MTSVAGLLPRFAARWHTWLFSNGELRALAIFRIGWALAMLSPTLQEAGRQATYLPGHYHLPLCAWIVPPDAHALHLLMRVALIGCVSALLGFLPRLGALAVVAAHGYLFAADVLLFRNHVYLGLLLGLLLAASPCGRVLSVDVLIRKGLGRPLPRVGSLAAVQLIKAQVLIVYAWSVVNKLRWSFLDGWTLQQELPHALRQSLLAALVHGPGGALRPGVAAVIANEAAMAACSWAVVAVEAFLVLGLPRARWRAWAAGLGLALHGFIFLSMSVLTFGLLMVASYPLFWQRPSAPALPEPGGTASPSAS
jgi:hypothetical protein